LANQITRSSATQFHLISLCAGLSEKQDERKCVPPAQADMRAT
jgi:hypothetical protein